MKAQQAFSVNKVIDLKDSVRNCRQYGEKLNRGILSDIRYCWLTNGPYLEVTCTKSGAKLVGWTFGHDITCLTDLPNPNGTMPYLIVGLDSGMVCVFDICTSHVLKAIEIDEKVTAVHVVSAGMNYDRDRVLNQLDGVLAVGTLKGKILLIDLCREQIDQSALNNYNGDMIRTCRLININAYNLQDIEEVRERAIQNGDHLCLQLNESSTKGERFILFGADGKNRLYVAMDEVAITSLHYCVQLASLLVGYNFGAFQLYNLLTTTLEYTSPFFEEYIPITHFALQEPCDDPRAFIYIWVMYNRREFDENGFPMAAMYALSFQTKQFLPDYGYFFYEELVTCTVRFEMNLSSEKRMKQAIGGRAISLQAHTKAILSKQDEELALCAITWTVWDEANQIQTFMCLFDLNQWYKEQMPYSSVNGEDSSYMIQICLSDFFDHPKHILDFQLDSTTISQFVCAQRLEEHFFPSAFSFKCICVRPNDLVWFENVGIQRHLLLSIENGGPLCLLRPGEIFHRCIALGLLPLYTELPSPVNESSEYVQREIILSIALEHQCIAFLCRCAKTWANGSQSNAGCTLDFLLKWAWDRTNIFKSNVNKLCVPLFDYSALKLDANGLKQLNHCTCQLKHLTTLFGQVLKHCTQFLTKEDIQDIEYQWKTLQMISVYLDVLQWLLNVGLLPECPLSMYPRSDQDERISAPYPVDILTDYYQTRRSDLNKLCSRPDDLNKSCELLFIDNFIDLECGNQSLKIDWISDGGTGLYPPPSLQAMLRIYLLEDIDIVHKHSLFTYFFLDLAMVLDKSRYKSIITYLIKFPAAFKVSPNLIKVIQAFWQLDHGEFSSGMTQLLDPNLGEYMAPWYHKLILKTLLRQDQSQHALLYYQIRNPPVTNLQDISVIITLYICNDMIYEAFHFQRQNRNALNEKQVLKCFLDVCDKTGHLSMLIRLTLDRTEENEFVKYIEAKLKRKKASNKYKCVLIVYYLQRNRYMDAFQLNEDANQISHGLLGQSDNNIHTKILTSIQQSLPTILQNLMEFCKTKKQMNQGPIPLKVNRPNPMSVLIHDTSEQAKYKSTIIESTLQKVRETWSVENDHQNVIPFISTPKAHTPSIETIKRIPLIRPSIINSCTRSFVDEDDLDMAEISAKKLRLSPRQSLLQYDDRNTQLNKFRSRLSVYDSVSLLSSTPVIKRKSYRSFSNHHHDDNSITTPTTSILKVKSLIRNSITPDKYLEEICNASTSTTPEQMDIITPSEQMDFIAKSKTKLLDVSARKPIERSAVRFQVNKPQLSKEHIIKIEKYCDTPPSNPVTRDQDSNSEPALIEEEKEDKRKSLKRKATGNLVQSRRSYKSNSDSFDSTKEMKTPPELLPKIGGRRSVSLSRQVLERTMNTRSSNKQIETFHTKTTSSIEQNSNEDILQKTKSESKNIYTTERDPKTQSQIIQVKHEEISTKSTLKLVDDSVCDSDSNSTTAEPILLNNSEVDDSFICRRSFISQRQPNQTINDTSMSSSSSGEFKNSNSLTEFLAQNKQKQDDVDDVMIEMEPNKSLSNASMQFEEIPSIIEDESIQTDDDDDNDDNSLEYQQNTIEITESTNNEQEQQQLETTTTTTQQIEEEEGKTENEIDDKQNDDENSQNYINILSNLSSDIEEETHEEIEEISTNKEVEELAPTDESSVNSSTSSSSDDEEDDNEIVEVEEHEDSDEEGSAKNINILTNESSDTEQECLNDADDFVLRVSDDENEDEALVIHYEDRLSDEGRISNEGDLVINEESSMENQNESEVDIIEIESSKSDNSSKSRQSSDDEMEIKEDISVEKVEQTTEDSGCDKLEVVGENVKNNIDDNEVFDDKTTEMEAVKTSSKLNIVKEPVAKRVTRSSSRLSKDSDEEPEIKYNLRTRKRSTSIDKPSRSEPKIQASSSSINSLSPLDENMPLSKRSLRASSVDKVTMQKSKGVRTRRASSSLLHDITELPVPPDNIEQYIATHRMTRAQESMMKKSMKLQELRKLENPATPSQLQRNDNVTPSPPKTSDRVLRKKHTNETTPTTSNISPKRKREKSSTPVRRSRRLSQDTNISDPCSITSAPPVPIQASPESIQIEQMRHRSLSPDMFKKEDSKGRKSTRRSILLKTDLTKIAEETTTSKEMNLRSKKKEKSSKSSESKEEAEQSSEETHQAENKSKTSGRRKKIVMETERKSSSESDQEKEKPSREEKQKSSHSAISRRKKSTKK